MSEGIHYRRFFIVGGAGFIGSHFCDHLLSDEKIERVTVFDNFSSGRHWHIAHHLNDKRFAVVQAEVTDLPKLIDAMSGHDVVIHLASNPDIAKAAIEPTIDFDQGTALTNNVIEAMRLSKVNTILYASGSGVYGDTGTNVVDEDFSPMLPISTYGASKLACEVLIASYCFMFDMRACAFRFGNVVGSRQTHGVGFDFVRRLRAEPTQLSILGDGSQTKYYVHVSDVIAGVMRALNHAEKKFNVFNLATGDVITVKEIAALACNVLGLSVSDVSFRYAGGDRGWKGDVPIIKLDTTRIKSLGWQCKNSSKEAMLRALESLLNESEKGLI